jgi:coenzyme F420-reducing hydrogenase delta subunit
MSGFEPQIVAFCCNYCSYTAADLAGSMRLDYPTNIKIIRVPCSGRITPITLLGAFEAGADGVYVAGCLDGDCHFMEGNFRAKQRMRYTKDLVAQAGLNPERVEMFQIEASNGPGFAEVAKDFTERIRKLGPTPTRSGRGTEWPPAHAEADGGAAAEAGDEKKAASA